MEICHILRLKGIAPKKMKILSKFVENLCIYRRANWIYINSTYGTPSTKYLF